MRKLIMCIYEDDEVDTVTMCNNSISYNKDFVNSLSPEDLASVITHEALHFVYNKHLVKR